MYRYNLGRSAGGVRRLAIAIFGIGVGCLSACSAGAVPRKEGAAGPKPAVPASGILLAGAGATFPSVLYEKWFSLYQKDHPDRVIAYEAVGSGEGVRRFLGKGVTDDEQFCSTRTTQTRRRPRRFTTCSAGA